MASGVVTSDIEKFITALSKEAEQSPSGDNYPGRQVIPRRLAAFEKLTRHAMNKFSVDRVYDFLRIVLQEFRSLSKLENVKSGDKKDAPPLLTTFQQVVDVMEQLTLKEAKQKLTDRQSHAVKFYSTFLNDYDYLVQAKQYFDNSVYWCLLEDFYDPNTTQPTSLLVKTSEKSSDSIRVTKNKDKPKQEKSSAKKPAESPGENDKKRLCHVVNQLEETLSKWQGVLQKGDLNPEHFDPDSYHEVVHFANFSSFELVLRIIPDIFVKCYKSIDLAREWLKLAERVYRGKLPLKRKIKRPNDQQEEVEEKVEIPVPRNSSREQKTSSPKTTSPQSALADYQKRVKELKNKLAEIDKDIDKKKSEIEVLHKDMKSLNARENRADQLSGNFNEIDGKIETAHDELTKILNEDNQSESNAATAVKVKDSKAGKKMEVLKREKELNLLKYQKSVIQEDYLLELEIRPNFIHIAGDIQGKIVVLKADVDAKNAQKVHLEQEINEMVTSSDHMKEKLSEYLGREATQSDVELAQDLLAVENGMSLSEEKEFSKPNDRFIESDQSFVSESEVDLAEYLGSTTSLRKEMNKSAKAVLKDSHLPPPKVVGHFPKINSAPKSTRTSHNHQNGSRKLSSGNRTS